MWEGQKFKRMGVAVGWPDIQLPYARKGHHGLFIELKREKGGVVSEHQVDWLKFLLSEGYYATVAHGLQQAKDLVCAYFDWPME
jgi:VRR-NUC domain-containing protein